MSLWCLRIFMGGSETFVAVLFGNRFVCENPRNRVLLRYVGIGEFLTTHTRREREENTMHSTPNRQSPEQTTPR